MKKVLSLAVGAGLLALASSSFAQLNSVGPFSGAVSEGFEGFNNYFSGPYDSISIMGGAATMSSIPTGSDLLWVYSPGSAGWGLYNGQAQVNSGANGMGLFNNSPGQVLITFGSAMSEFGGYFSDVAAGFPQVSVTLYDSSMTQLGGVQTLPSANALDSLMWEGWSSTAGIKYVLFDTVGQGGCDPVMDDLQATPSGTPEPFTMALGVAGAGMFVRRKISSKKA